MKMKKWIALAMCLVLMISLAACRNKDKEQPEGLIQELPPIETAPQKNYTADQIRDMYNAALDKLAKAEAYGILDYLGVKVQEVKPAPAPATPAGGIDITKLTDDQILYLAKRIREVEAKQTNSAASELRAAFDSMI
mgnify:CR=1 FL=1